MSFVFFKKEFRLGFMLLIVFGLFLFTIDQTSEQIVYSFAQERFTYYKPAFLKTMYIVLAAVILALSITLNKNQSIAIEKKKNAFTAFISWTTFSFFPGWLIHLFYIIQTLEKKGSFMTLENQFWIYYAHDITLCIGFCLSAFLILKPIINTEN